MGLRTELKAQSATIHPSVPPVQLLPVHRRRLVGKSTRILSNRLRRRLRKARKASKRSSDIARDSKAGLLRLSRLFPSAAADRKARKEGRGLGRGLGQHVKAFGQMAQRFRRPDRIREFLCLHLSSNAKSFPNMTWRAETLLELKQLTI